MPVLFDTHAHLDFGAYDNDRGEVLARARKAGVEYVTVIGSGEGLKCQERAIAAAEKYDGLWATAGVHPHDAKLMSAEVLDWLRGLLGHEKVVALGEVGLDFFKNHSPRKDQVKWFREQLALARELDMPVVIHDRDAHREVLGILKDDGAPKAGGIMHCFSGDAGFALEMTAMGFYISFPGVLTYKNARDLPAAARAVPEDRLLIETDCPFLTPAPHRGKRNEPAYVKFVAEKLAEVRGVALEHIAQATTRNAFRAYGLPEPARA